MVSGTVLDIDLDTGSQEERQENLKNPFRIKRERILPKGT